MFEIVEDLTEYSRVIEYSFSVRINNYVCSGLFRFVLVYGEFESEKTIIWDTYHPNFPRLTKEQEDELIEKLFDVFNNSY